MHRAQGTTVEFPFLLGGTFNEALATSRTLQRMGSFPYSFVGAFIEATSTLPRRYGQYGISLLFGGLSLRQAGTTPKGGNDDISLPFWRGFH